MNNRIVMALLVAVGLLGSATHLNGATAQEVKIQATRIRQQAGTAQGLLPQQPALIPNIIGTLTTIIDSSSIRDQKGQIGNLGQYVRALQGAAAQVSGVAQMTLQRLGWDLQNLQSTIQSSN